jgi:serine/threonine protein kinase
VLFLDALISTLRCTMSEAWNNWIGQVVDHKYQLKQYLGTTDHSVVFLAEFHDPELRQATVKFVSADFAEREEQVAAWKEAAQLSHPHLIRIYGAGACAIEGMDLLYVAMEHAEENLGQVLPHRALVEEETKEMLSSVVDALVYLHDRELVHGHVKPSNLLATGDVLKLSSDTISRSGLVREMRRERSPYDAPELPGAPYTAAADMWSIGVTLVEALTQQPAVLPFNENADPVVPATVHEPYQEIAGHVLRRNPRLRWDIGQLAEELNPAAAEAKAVAAVAGARVSGAAGSASAGTMSMPQTAWSAPPAISPLTVPVSNEPAVPPGKLPSAPARVPERPRPRYEELTAPSQTVALPSYVIPLFAAVLLVIALVVLPFALRHKSKPDSNGVASTSGAASSTQAGAGQRSSSANEVAAPAKAPATKPGDLAPKSTTPAAVAAPAAPASSHRDEPAAAVKAESPYATVGSSGEPMDKVAPTVSPKALATIHGTVRVGVKVHVDAAGKVTEAALDSGGPSRYFADLSLKAARQWVFTAPDANGHSAPSDWKIQFRYTQSGVQMSAEPLTP